MIRNLFAIGTAFLLLGCTSQPYPRGPVDLDVSGNLEAVARANPAHFATIQRILAEVPQQPPTADSVARWMRTEFQARDIRYSDLVMTSLPPKKRLEFSLDNTSYVTVITLKGWDAKPRPLKEAPAK